ncbi:nucleotide disphospho-sugar-binding domain-containing protein [Lentzea sp. NPDC058436]|uniref:nucleotide disphospho-sugar-binding domain-containing protein n=1 Tax=Lentzea sp. NPDC058436 TaxID=3346499 RepID=UPI00365BD65D
MGILFVTLAGHGHVTPTLAVVAELAGRGAAVDYATGAEHAEAVTGAGARWVKLPALPDFRPVTGNPIDEWFPHYFRSMAATYPVLLDRCRAARPDLICYDSTNWPARIVAHTLGIPAVRTVPHTACNAHYNLMDAHVARFIADDLAEFRARYDVDLDIPGTIEAPEACSIVFVPREFQPRAETFDETFHFVGPVLGDRLDEQWSPRRTDLPLLFMSLGSVMSDAGFYEACLDQFADGAWQVTMTARDVQGTDVVDVRALDVPQPAVLRHAKAFISHGGMNSTMEALHQGVPLVVVSQTPEQAANADRVAELGLGERVDDHADLRAAVDRVVACGTIRRNLDRMRAAISGGGGAAEAAEVILRRIV